MFYFVLIFTIAPYTSPKSCVAENNFALRHETVRFRYSEEDDLHLPVVKEDDIPEATNNRSSTLEVSSKVEWPNSIHPSQPPSGGSNATTTGNNKISSV